MPIRSLFSPLRRFLSTIIHARSSHWPFRTPIAPTLLSTAVLLATAHFCLSLSLAVELLSTSARVACYGMSSRGVWNWIVVEKPVEYVGFGMGMDGGEGERFRVGRGMGAFGIVYTSLLMPLVTLIVLGLLLFGHTRPHPRGVSNRVSVFSGFMLFMYILIGVFENLWVGPDQAQALKGKTYTTCLQPADEFSRLKSLRKERLNMNIACEILGGVIALCTFIYTALSITAALTNHSNPPIPQSYRLESLPHRHMTRYTSPSPTTIAPPPSPAPTPSNEPRNAENVVGITITPAVKRTRRERIRARRNEFLGGDLGDGHLGRPVEAWSPIDDDRERMDGELGVRAVEREREV